ncbi:MAG: acyl-CoA/acyl-ACP dehydrogenase [Deltaproteobacteria bacterium]|nr:acyl-CoA/acyl-ACP dehydrogenase [Deltaproteobacteria bacterium]
MNLDFTTEQKLIKDEALKFLKKESPFERVKEIEETEEGYCRKTWKKMAELGWLGLSIPEQHGGEGGQFLDMVILLEEMGRAAFPGPYFSTIAQCALIIIEGGSEEQKKQLLPEIAEGKLIMGLAQYEEDGSFYPDDIRMKAELEGDQYNLNGTKMFAMDANISSKLIVAVNTGEEQLSLLLVDTSHPGLTITKMPTIGMDNCCEVVFKNVGTAKGNLIGSPGNGKEILERMNAKAMLLKSAEMIGASKACIDMTVDFAKQRVQYGKPIGGFQIIQHYMANMQLEYDTCYNYLYRTACMVEEGGKFERDASAVKACTNEAYKFISERGVQIFGGIGTTREGDVGLFFRKAKSAEVVCGNTEYLNEKVFASLLQEI